MARSGAHIFVLPALMALGACAAAPQQTPAPIVYGSAAPPAPRAAARTAPQPAVTPRPGASQSPPSASASGEFSGALIDYALDPADAHPFDPLRPEQTHRVAPGETLYAVASRRQVPLRALIDANGLAPPFGLTAGQILRLPPPLRHRVAQGETLRAIAQAYAVDPRSLALLNRLREPYELTPGQELVLPGLTRATPQPSPPAQPTSHRAAPPAANPADAARFSWPASGAIVARFGPAGGGARLDGVEIALAQGGSFVAAASGEVVYAGQDLAAYDGLIIIAHAGDWVTAYAYAGALAVREGQRVARGQTLGQAGRRGRLLFQVRRASRPLDPETVLPRR